MTINKRIDAAIANNGTVAGQKPEELKRQLMNGDITVNKAYQDLRREEKKQAVQQRIEEYATVQTGTIDIFSRRYGKRIPADTVHHVFPREEFPEYQWQAWNLVSLASDVHNRMHDRNTNALTEEGAELLRRTARRYGADIPPQYR